MNKIKAVILDYGGVIFNPKTNSLVPGIMDLIKNLRDKQYTLALVTKAENIIERQLDLQTLGLNKLIDFTEVLPLNKPKNFERILRKFNLKPQECIILGDYVKSEIKEGNKLGITTVWYKNGEFPNVLKSKIEITDYEIGSINEFEQVLHNIQSEKVL